MYSSLNNGGLGGAAHGGIKVAGSLAEHDVAGLVCLPPLHTDVSNDVLYNKASCLDECVFAGDGLLHNVVGAAEVALLARLAFNVNHALALVLDRRAAKVDDCHGEK